MADLRTPLAGSSLVPQPRQAPARAEAVRAAQRAFFQAALNGAVAEPARQVQPSAPMSAAPPVQATTPDQMLRPGSLIDIKV